MFRPIENMLLCAPGMLFRDLANCRNEQKCLFIVVQLEEEENKGEEELYHLSSRIRKITEK